MIKPGVDLRGLKPQMAIAYVIATGIYAKHHALCVITSGSDGKHGPHSLHYSGNALDLRTNMLNGDERVAVHQEIKIALGVQFDVVLESDHIHVEFDVKDFEKIPEEA